MDLFDVDLYYYSRDPLRMNISLQGKNTHHFDD